MRIHLFEPLCVGVGERAVLNGHFRRHKAKALFVYLYLKRGRYISKYRLLADLWPHAEEADTDRVKHTVQVLRAALEGRRPADGWHYILEKGGAYAFNAEAERWSDLEEFERELCLAGQALGQGDDALALDHHWRAVELNRGEFLDEFRYEDWAADEIALVQERYLHALEQAAHLEAARGAYRAAIALLRKALVEDPLHESSYLALMRYLALDGRRTEALRVYHRLRTVLARHLGVKPQVEAVRLYEAISQERAAAV